MRKRIALFFMAGCMTVLSTFNIAVYPQAAESKEDSAYTTNDEEFTKILDEYGFTLEALLEDYDPEEDPYDWKDHTYEIEKKSLPIYYYEPSKKEEIDLYFMDGEGGIPYISSRDVPEFIGKTVSEDSEDDSEYKIFRCEEGSKTFFIRETMYSVMFDFEEDIIRFQDFDAYIVPSSKATLIDVIGDTGRFTPEGEERLIKIDQEGSYNRFGHSVTVNTRDYGIDLISQDGDYYIPLQVISDFLMAPGLYRSTLFNGGTVYVISGGNYAPLLETLSEGYIDNSGDALNRFSYNELCMVLDSFYGLKEQHGITSFDDFFRET
ncbi:MAG: hypothetical protein K6B28_03865, partial [Lachnospiraceae bacterium]|nr:hypothetical protein [Lachnospiraceae bacterium]